MKSQQIYTSLVFCAVIFLHCCVNGALAQAGKYTTANAHAHNDYNHARPFHSAFNAGFGSIEADIFLKNGRLYVAHDTVDILPERTLESLYLKPLQEVISKNNGYAYADSIKHLLLLIDIKTAAEPTLDVLLALLRQYKQLTDCRSLKIVITGNRPIISKWQSYPTWLFFDGRLNETYTAPALDKIALFSANLMHYAEWKGEGAPAKSDRKKIKAAVKKVHKLNKPMRFWAAPDSPEAWRELMKLNVDYINTDKIHEMAEFLSRRGSLHPAKW